MPALALLAAWLAGNGVELAHSLSTTFAKLQDLPVDVSVEQLQGLVSGAAVQAQDVGWSWRIVGVLADAIAWWYTLCVCYAEYRALKEQDPAQAKDNKAH